MKRFEDYKKAVILAYEKKKKEGTLPPNLYNPTAANLKSECLNVFHNRYSVKDAETFKTLFKERNSAEEYLKIIQNADADQFKALSNFLKEKTKNTSDRYIELLAWLIDFEERPHVQFSGYEIPGDSPAIPVTAKQSEGGIIAKPESPSTQLTADITEPQDDTTGFLSIPTKHYKTIILGFLAFFTISGSYFIYQSNKPECMYWDGDQYQYTSCEEQKPYGAIVLPLDTFKFARLKRIKDPKSIRQSDIGKVHYSKTNNEVEFYTIESENPTDTAKRLLPMSDHIYDKYVLGKE